MKFTHVCAYVTAAAATMLLTGTASAALFAKSETAQQQRADKTAEIPVCAKKLGTLAVVEPERNWWVEAGLGSPEALIKLFVNKSKCFTLVDRGKGMAAAQAERALASSGELRGRSNVGKGQVKAADYVLVPDLVSKNSNAGGNRVGAMLGGLIGGGVGAIVGGINLKKKTADVMLTVTDVRSSEQKAMTEGHAEKKDLGWGAGGGFFSGGGFAAAGASGYSDTEIGQVITLAYLDSYTKLIAELTALPENASAANEQQSVNMNKPGRMYAKADGKGAVVRTLDPGMILYPTGEKQGVMWEVEDELGNKGWVSSLLFELAK